MTTTPATEAAPPAVEPTPQALPVAATPPPVVPPAAPFVADATPVAPEGTPTPYVPGTTPVPTPPAFDPQVFSTLTVEQLESIPAFQQVLGQRESAIRERTESESQVQLQNARQQWYQRGGYARNLEQHLAEQAAANKPVDPQFIERVVDEMWLANSHEGYAAMDRVLNAALPGDIQMTKKQVDDFDRVRADVAAGRKPLDAMIEARWQQSLASYAEHVLKPQLREQMRQEQASQAQTEQLRQAEAQRTANGTPTLGITGNPGGGAFRSQAEVRIAHANGVIDNNEMRRIRDSGQLATLPPTV